MRCWLLPARMNIRSDGVAVGGVEQFGDDFLGECLVVGAGTFHQGDGLPQHDAVASADALHECLDGG